jgi:hypothetical protein
MVILSDKSTATIRQLHFDGGGSTTGRTERTWLAARFKAYPASLTESTKSSSPHRRTTDFAGAIGRGDTTIHDYQRGYIDAEDFFKTPAPKIVPFSAANCPSAFAT